MIAASNTAFTGVNSTMSLEAVRVFMPVFSTTVVVEQFETLGGMSPAAQGSGVVMAQCSRRWWEEAK